MSVKILAPFIFPNMTTTQRDAMPSLLTPTGAVIFNTTTGTMQVNTGTSTSPSWNNQ